ncbi:MAG: nuclear transport factor 2 family protein [Reichenbachiella sp.]|uniref:nuclear transport factor 2 family protein n=1 Tax=Reichenbachiella sp. TaxID=2184521 RepID=UPI003267E14C
MKKYLTVPALIILMSFLHMSVNAQTTSDEVQIRSTIQNYFDGSHTDNPELLKAAFHPDATLKYIKEGKYQMIPIQKYFTFFTNSKKREFEEKIFYVDQYGNAANVKLSARYATYQFVDYMNLLKTEEGWKIVSKISHCEEF